MRAWGLMLVCAGAFALYSLAEPAAAVPGVNSIASPHRLAVPAFHPGRSTSFYCYPRNYWWFYRPYTTAADGYQRCMPYFHYPQGPRRGGPGRLK